MRRRERCPAGEQRLSYKEKRGEDKIADPNGYRDHDPYLFPAISFQVVYSISVRHDGSAQSPGNNWEWPEVGR